MVHAKLIKKITEDGLKLELYSDGDCLVISHPPGFFCLSAELIRRISSNNVIKIENPHIDQNINLKITDSVIENNNSNYLKIEPVILKNITHKIKTSKDDIDDIIIDEKSDDESKIVHKINTVKDRIMRQIQRNENVHQGGWLCIMKTGQANHIKYVYINRSSARAGVPSDTIGMNGRIY